MSAMITDDGWRVELIELDGRPEFRVTRTFRGARQLMGGAGGSDGTGGARLKDRGRHFTAAAVAATLGTSFALLRQEDDHG